MKPKKVQLVCQHLEMISRKALEKYQGVLKEFVRRRHGIYALYRGDRLYYVGLAKNLRSRLSHHLRDRHAGTWDRFSVYITLESDRMREIESLAVRIAAPKGNRQKGKIGKSQDLRRHFRREVASHLRSELDGLFPGGGRKHSKVPRPQASQDDTHPVLTGYFPHGAKLRWTFKGRTHSAYVKRNGSIRFRRKIYNSPSSAASAVTHRAMNGWACWRYERAPGDWILLDELRR